MKNKFLSNFIKKLANLQFAITNLFTIGFIIAIGTIIEQGQPLTFYQENYPETKPTFGFLTWKVITFLNFDRIYTAWWFIFILILFAASLLSCTFTTQLPSIKTFKIWKFYNKKTQLNALSSVDEMDSGLFNSFAYFCNDNRYHFFRQNKKGYAYSGLLGRVAPVVVHISIVLLLLGSIIGSFSGYIAQQFSPRGELFHIQNLTSFSNLSSVPNNLVFRINDFWITYTQDLKTEQFYSDLSILTDQGKELKRKKIFVNEPFLFNDIVLYQTDWDIVGVKLNASNKEVFQVPVKKITKSGRKFWFCSLPTGLENGQKISLVINDLSGSCLVYDSKGVLLKKLKVGDYFNLSENMQIQIVEFITATGLQIKSDPGLQLVYLSFFLLILSIYVSFFTYSQIWLFENFSKIEVGGTSNRAVLFFQQEFRKMLGRAA